MVLHYTSIGFGVQLDDADMDGFTSFAAVAPIDSTVSSKCGTAPVTSVLSLRCIWETVEWVVRMRRKR